MTRENAANKAVRGLARKDALYWKGKRVFDIAAACAMLAAAWPVMLLAAAAIRLEDGGPVLYRQKRLTKDGRIFEIYKFRSMRTDAEKDGVARLASAGDERITRVGQVIRAAHIDELPQIFNILRGEMSVVGPRPERPEIAARYAKTLPEFGLRLQVKAGLTGYAQVHGRYDTQPREKLQMDLLYIANMSLLLDVWLILKTIRLMLVKERAAGCVQSEK